MNISELKKTMDEARAKMREHVKAALSETFVAFFKENPEVSRIQWAQYTPYFNDGDSCTFSVRDAEASIEGISEEIGGWSLTYRYGPNGEHKDHPNAARLVQIGQNLDSLDKTIRGDVIDEIRQALRGGGVKRRSRRIPRK